MHVMMFFGDVSFIIKGGGPQGCDTVCVAGFVFPILLNVCSAFFCKGLRGQRGVPDA